MLKISSNWNEVKSSIIEDMRKVVKDTKRKALLDIKNKLNDKGIDNSKLKIKDDRIVYSTDDAQDFENGKIYFDEVFEEISDKNWLESIK